MEMIFISLFNYILKPVNECAFPINKNGKKNICWFWLTDSNYYIKLGEIKLFELSSESMKKYDFKSCFDDYYYIRQLEDLFEILPTISNPVLNTMCSPQHHGGKPALLYPIMCVEHGSDKRYLISHSASIKR